MGTYKDSSSTTPRKNSGPNLAPEHPISPGFYIPNHSGAVKTPVNAYDLANKKYVDDNAGGAPEGTAVKSTGEAGGVKFLREDGDGTSSWQTPDYFTDADAVSAVATADDYLKNDASDTSTGTITAAGFIVSGDSSSADTAYVPMVLYNTDETPPAASGFPVGTIYIQYTP